MLLPFLSVLCYGDLRSRTAFAGQAVVAFCFRIKIFVDMYQMRMEGKEQAQFIKGGILFPLSFGGWRG